MIFYFGTFNPVHLGHIKIANTVQESYGEKVVFVPAYDSPWKPNLKKTFENRCKMIKLCNQEVLEIEKDLPVPSYTYQTVELISKTWKPVKIIIGYDQFFSLPKWKNSDILKSLCEFIVIPRDIGKTLIEVNEKYKKMIDEGWRGELLQIPLINMSSSEIRESLMQKKVCNELAPEVLKYIEENQSNF